VSADAAIGESWRRIAPYVSHVLDLEPDEREAWLKQLAGTEPEIERLVREWLSERDALDAVGFLEASLASALGPLTLAGRKIGAYTIERLLGRGGMGEVWLATRSDGRFEGLYAIKLINLSLAHARLADRFQWEGRLLARLAHPHIARLLDAGSTEEGRPYLILEYVDGERIDHYCSARALSIEARVRLFADVASAVAHAHAHLIIHRDLKPNNVLVSRDGMVKLLDFGVAKLLEPDAPGTESNVTALNEAALTPEYAAPEQLLGEAPSTATDVYQLGMLLYVLLTETHPLQGARSRAECVQAALNGRLPRASELARGATRKALRGDLDAILSWALRRNPDERYATAAALHDDLLRYLNREPVSARRGMALYRAHKFVQRHWLAVAGSALAVISLCVMLVFALSQAHEAAAQRDTARLEAKRADAETRFMTLMLSQVGSVGKPITQEQILANGLKLLDAHYADDPRFIIDMLIRISGRYMDLGDHQREHDVLVKAETLARKINDPLRLARVQCSTVDTETLLGFVDRAEARFNEGRSVLARAAGRTVRDEVDCLNAGAALRVAQGRIPEAVQDLEHGVAALEAHGMTNTNQYTYLLSHLAGLYSRTGDTRRHYDVAHKARIAEDANHRTDTMGLLGALHNESVALRELGEIRAALALSTQVLTRQRAAHSDEAIAARVTGHYALLLIRLNQTQQAFPWLDLSLANARNSGDVVGRLHAHVSRAMAHLDSHREADASADLEVVENTARQGSEGIHVPVLRAQIVRSRLLASQERLDDAQQIIEAALEQTRDQNKGLSSYRDDALLQAARVLLAQGRSADALLYAKQALALSESRARNPAHSADVGEAALLVGQAERLLTNCRQASTLATRAAATLLSSLGETHPLTRAAFALQSDPTCLTPSEQQ